MNRRTIYAMVSYGMKKKGWVFMLAIEATLRIIERNPFTYSKAPTNMPNIRRAIVFKFSYSIFYSVIDQSVIILAVVSSKQDTAIWKTRIGDV